MLLEIQALLGESAACEVGEGQTEVIVLRLVARQITFVAWNVEVLLCYWGALKRW